MNSELQVNNILKSIGKNGLIYGVSAALQPLGGFILLPLYSENFEKSEFAVYTLILLISTIFSTVFHLGINSAFIRSYYDYDSADGRIKVFNTSLFMLLIGFILQLLTIFILAKFLSVSILDDKIYVVLLIISVISSGIGFVNTGFLNYLRVKEKLFQYTSVSSLALIVNVISTLYLFEYFDKSINSPIYSALISQSISFFILVIINIKDINLFHLNKSEFKTQLRFGLPSIFAGFTIMIGEWGDKFLINEYLNKDELGIYSMGFRIAMIYNVAIALPFTLVWNPLMLRLKNHENLQDIFSRITFLYFGISLIFIFTFSVLIGPILYLVGFDSKFNESISCIPIIMIAIAFGSLLNIYSAGIVYVRKPIILVYVFISMGGLNLVVSYFVIKKYGLYGIIVTFMVFKLLSSLLIYYFSSKYFKFTIFNLNYLKLSLLFSLTISLYFNYISSIQNINLNIIYIVISIILLIYFVLKYENFKFSKVFLNNSS